MSFKNRAGEWIIGLLLAVSVATAAYAFDIFGGVGFLKLTGGTITGPIKCASPCNFLQNGSGGNLFFTNGADLVTVAGNEFQLKTLGGVLEFDCDVSIASTCSLQQPMFLNTGASVTCNVPCTFLSDYGSGPLVSTNSFHDLFLQPGSASRFVNFLAFDGTTMLGCGSPAKICTFQQITPSSSVACPTGYTRSLVIWCVRTTATGVTEIINTTCTTLSIGTDYGVSATTVLIRPNLAMGILDGTVAGTQSVTVTFYSDAACTTKLGGDGISFSPAYEVASLSTAGTSQIIQQPFLYVNGATTIYAKYVGVFQTGGSGSVSILDIPLMGS